MCALMTHSTNFGLIWKKHVRNAEINFKPKITNVNHNLFENIKM